MLLGRDPAIDGMKTGYTDAAGYCLIASAKRAMPGGERRLLSVVLGTSSREARAGESQKLLNWGWQAWDMVRLFDPGKAVVTVPVWKGNRAEVGLGARGGLFVTVPRGEGDKLKTTIERTDPLVAPLSQGQARRHDPHRHQRRRRDPPAAAGGDGAGGAGRLLRPRLGRDAAVDQVSWPFAPGDCR